VRTAPARLGLLEIREGARQRQQAIVEHVPGDAARLPQHLHRGFRVAVRLVVEAPALRVQLHAAFHHHGPGHQDAVRHHPRAVALVAAEVGQPRAQRRAPEDGAAVVAGVAAEGGAAISGSSSHHRRVAAEAVAGQQQHVAAQRPAAVGAAGSRCRRAVGIVEHQLSTVACGEHGNAPASSRPLQRVTNAAPVFCGTACMRRTPWPG
jgi:hypothetical protein